MPTKTENKKTDTSPTTANGKKGAPEQQQYNLEKNLLTFEDGIITLGGEELPGILRGLNVQGQVRFDEAKTDSMSGKKKTPMGFEDCAISITLELQSDDESYCYMKLATINSKFQGLDGKAAPQIYEVFNRHLDARGIEKIIFSKLHSTEDDELDIIMANLGFEEHNPPVIRRERQVIEAKSAEAKAAADAKPDLEKLAAEVKEVTTIDLKE